jgi:hypothetical protein
MSKLAAETLIEEVQSELVTFLQSGTIAEHDVVSTLDFTDLEIDEFSRLKRIHFCLSDPVVDFVDQLPDRLRGIKTATQRERVNTKGEIRGSIDWSETTKLRHTESIGDRSVFACESPYVEYDIPENLVLKRLLWVIYRTATQELREFEYEWRRTQWSDEDIRQFERLYNRNIHLNRIRDGDSISLTRRDLTAARTARGALYTEAYDRFDTYDQLQENDFSGQKVQKLLRDTLIVPERLPRLFELFCVFKLIRVLADLYSGLSLQVIEPGASEIAVLAGESRRIEIYHDKQGSLRFREQMDDIEAETPFFKRYQDVFETHEELLDAFLSRGAEQTLYSGRPDVVVEIYSRDASDWVLSDILLGEIKYTESDQAFSRGLRELIEYAKFARIGSGKNDYIDEIGSISVSGLLITDGVETESITGPIRHLTAEQLPAAGKVVRSLLDDTVGRRERIEYGRQLT